MVRHTVEDIIIQGGLLVAYLTGLISLHYLKPALTKQNMLNPKSESFALICKIVSNLIALSTAALGICAVSM